MNKTSITRRKFYGKWLYRASFRLPGIAIMRMHTLDNVIKFLQEDHTEETLKYSYHKKAYFNREDIISLCQFLLKENSNSWSKRIEVSNIDIYTNDNNLYTGLIEKFKHILISNSQPDLSRSAEYEDQNHIVCDKLPHNRYKYKVFLRPHKMKYDKEGKAEYLSWLDKQKNVLISEAVKNWFMSTDWNWDRRYILVEDNKTLLFLHMRNADVLGKVYEYVLSDK
ncbi:hypothetical protein EBU71_19830 [bacterium]|jgi:hypothetical protein|nr:hypothetical protein [Candidatus Elulimicrobium humile]